MRINRGLLFAIFAGSLASACASAPISVVRSDAVETSARIAPEQQDLREAALALESTYERNGWSQAVDAMQSARRWVGTLTGQTTDVSNTPAPTQSYLTHNEFVDMSSEQAADQLSEDLQSAYALAGDVDYAAMVVAGSVDNYSRYSLTSDLGHIEGAIAHTRRALAMFDDVISRIGEGFTPEQLRRVHDQRNRLASSSEELRDRADEISRRRRSARANTFS
ncbi:MAG: hypothetical protein P8J78_04480 [Maricaulis sp.]|jgi:hypothetical protein|nr:hypothetical protein [Maricaulis sp.]MDG2043847.1 hypothetical protein [Maricaulis sp.]